MQEGILAGRRGMTMARSEAWLQTPWPGGRGCRPLGGAGERAWLQTLARWTGVTADPLARWAWRGCRPHARGWAAWLQTPWPVPLECKEQAESKEIVWELAGEGHSSRGASELQKIWWEFIVV